MNILRSLSNLFKSSVSKEEEERFFEKEGRQFNIRPISASDKQEIVHGFESISSETRHKRFLAYKKSLTNSEIEFLSHPDFVNHFAYGIQEIKNGTKTPFGISRFVRDPDDPTLAEFAIALRDDYQGKGLGFELLDFTIKEARKNQISVLYGLTLPDNDGILKLMRKFGKVEMTSDDFMRKVSLLIT
jgi:RimJ/RimL family protein N-acetyltransferase